MIYLQPVDGVIAHVRYQPPADTTGWVEWEGEAFAGDAWDGETVTPAAAVGATLEQKRAAKSLARQELHLELLDREILTPSDAARAARREWPVVLEPMLSGLPEKVSARYRIVWATSERIQRMHPLLLEVAKPENLNLSDATLDEIFGIE